MQSTDVPAKFAIPFAANADAARIRAIPTASQIGIVDGAASLSDGFPPLTFTPVEAGGVSPDGKDFNGILNALSAWARWVAAGGTVRFDPAFAAIVSGYPKGAILASSTPGKFWSCTSDGNGGDPDGGAAGWQPIGPAKASVEAVAAGTDDTAFVTPAGLAAAMTGLRIVDMVVGVNGYKKYSNGYMEQTGRFDRYQQGPGTYALTFAFPFANACFNISVTSRIPNAANGNNTLVEIVDGSVTATGCLIQVNSPSSSGAFHSGVYYQATGN